MGIATGLEAIINDIPANNLQETNRTTTTTFHSEIARLVVNTITFFIF
jgi:hypothetical protein